MPRLVAVPEKTIEHWCSQHILYRYLTKAALWWPATGQDIDFRCLPSRPGKAVQLELKTITATGSHRYEVRVDLGQLWEYRQRPLGHQPFYAFPWPRPGWSGSLGSIAAAAGTPVTELAFSERGSGLWFARWMVVLTAADVAKVLHNDLTAHGRRTRGKTVPLVRFDHGHQAWSRGASNPGTVHWLEFWDALEQCGRSDWPQLIRLPKHLVSGTGHYGRPEVISFLQRMNSQATPKDVPGSELVTLAPDRDGAFRVTPTDADAPDADPIGTDEDDEDDRSNEPSDQRLVAFLGANAIRGTGTPRQ